MDTLKRITVLLLAAALVYAGAAALHPPQARAGINTGVIVNNPASQPVPISGNVGINGTPTVQLAPGTTVGVTGGTFNFSNTSSTPIFTNPALTPFTTMLCQGTTNNGVIITTCGVSGEFTVGAQRLVIEYVTVQGRVLAPGSISQCGIFTTAGGTRGFYNFPVGPPNGAGDSILNQQTRIYADPGTTVIISTNGSNGSTSGLFTCNATLSGYLVTP